MIKWTEEDIKFVIDELIVPVFKQYIEVQQETDGMIHESYMKTLDKMATRIREIDYERTRDRVFFMSYIGRLDRLHDVKKVYKDFCDEYDKHNKHLLNVEQEVSSK